MEANIIYIPIILSLLGLIFMYVKATWVRNQDPGNKRMQEISTSIKQGCLLYTSDAADEG